MSLFDLSGQVALITGSSRGIGLSIAQHMAAQGARVVISSRKADVCEAAAASINARHGEGAAVALAASIGSKESLERLVDQALAKFGRIDALVCNAATNPYYGPMSGISDEQFRKVFENNILANHWLVQMVAPQMQQRRSGSITIVSSTGGLRSSPVIGAYNVSKAADFQLARNLAVELGPWNIRVNCLAPGLVKTDFAQALWENPVTLARATGLTPLGRIGQPDEIAGAAVFLASAAGAYITGQTIVIDGGAIIRGQD